MRERDGIVGDPEFFGTAVRISALGAFPRGDPYSGGRGLAAGLQRGYATVRWELREGEQVIEVVAWQQVPTWSQNGKDLIVRTCTTSCGPSARSNRRRKNPVHRRWGRGSRVHLRACERQTAAVGCAVEEVCDLVPTRSRMGRQPSKLPAGVRNRSNAKHVDVVPNSWPSNVRPSGKKMACSRCLGKRVRAADSGHALTRTAPRHHHLPCSKRHLPRAPGRAGVACLESSGSAILFGFEVCWAPDRAPLCRCGSWSSSVTGLIP